MASEVAYASFIFLERRIFQSQSWVTLKENLQKIKSHDSETKYFMHEMLLAMHHGGLEAHSSESLT